MFITKKLAYIAVVACLVLGGATTVLAAAQVGISPGGMGVFILQGAGFDNVAGLTISIGYDTATLANPRVSQGVLASEALMAANTASPGIITLAMMQGGSKGITGTGVLATITFDLPGSSPGVIQSLKVIDIINSRGAKIASLPPQIINPVAMEPLPVPSRDEPTTPQGGDGSSPTNTSQPTQVSIPAIAGAGASPNLVGGELVMPGEGDTAKPVTAKPGGEDVAEAKAPQKETPVAPVTADNEATPSSRDTGGSEATGKSETAKSASSGITQKSVLEQFRLYQGPKTPQALVAIFDQGAQQGFRQEPRVVLSDGTATVKIFITLTSPGKDAPSFALANANLESLKREGDKTWIVEALPAKGVYEATVRVLNGGSLTEIPLTVAPPLPKEPKTGTGGGLSEADFNRYLKEAGNAKAPLYDLNGDARRDYIDDYIFTANYIVASDRGKKVTAKEPK